MNKSRLPETLVAIKDDIRGVAAPQDPETGTEYVYTIKAPENFSLCANFSRPSLLGSDSNIPKPAYPREYYSGQQNWEHGAGYVCFERTIDKEIYKPIKER